MAYTDRIRLTRLLSERLINDTTMMKVYKGYSVKKQKDKPRYINCVVKLFGKSNDTNWHMLLGNWIHGELEIENVKNSYIVLTGSLSKIGIRHQHQLQQKVEESQDEIVQRVLSILDIGGR